MARPSATRPTRPERLSGREGARPTRRSSGGPWRRRSRRRRSRPPRSAAVGESRAARIPSTTTRCSSFGEARVGRCHRVERGRLRGSPTAMDIAVRDTQQVVERLHDRSPRYEEARGDCSARVRSRRGRSPSLGEPRVGAELGPALGRRRDRERHLRKGGRRSDVALALVAQVRRGLQPGLGLRPAQRARRRAKPAGVRPLATYEALFGSSDACACAHAPGLRPGGVPRRHAPLPRPVQRHDYEERQHQVDREGAAPRQRAGLHAGARRAARTSAGSTSPARTPTCCCRTWIW